MSNNKKFCPTTIGGQALIEGIMMRGPFKTAVSIRLPDKQISTEYMETDYLSDKYKIFKKPIMRGFASLIDSLKIGYKALSVSAEKSGLAEEEELKQSKFEKWLNEKLGDKVMSIIMIMSTILGIALAILLFMVLPTFLYNMISLIIPSEVDTLVLRSIIEGIIRILIFIAYIAICSLMPDIKRVFSYHGAEHKTIFCYEAGEELTVENVKKYKRFHPRCGTSFLIIMLLISIIIGFFIPAINPWIRSVIKILCIPVIVSLGYELIRFCGRYNNIITRIISAPGLWIQRITTKEPEDDMIQVAIEALKAVIPPNDEDKVI